MFESQIVVSALVREQHAVVERILAAQVVAQHNVRQFMGEHSRKAGLIGKHVN